MYNQKKKKKMGQDKGVLVVPEGGCNIMQGGQDGTH